MVVAMTLASMLGWAALCTMSCGGSKGSGTNGTQTVPCAGLSVSTSQRVQCQGDDCLVLRCSSSAPLCVSRSAAHVKTTVSFTTCDQILFPDWFYANDCWVGVFPDVKDWHATGFLCFCGRTSTGFQGAVFNYAGGSYWNDTSCDLRGGPTPETMATLAADCVTVENECTPTCTPRCSGRVCGPDGCGASCGSCASGTCGTNGQCGSSGDSCSSCIQSCSGMGDPCCTGCGCVCQDECGGWC